MTKQATGICAWKSLLAFLRTYMDYDEYKRFKCEIKLESLVDYVRHVPEGETLEEWRLVNKSFKSLSRFVPELYRKKIIEEQYLIQATKQLEEVSDWIKKNKGVRYKNPTPIVTQYQPLSKEYSVRLSPPLAEWNRASANKDISTSYHFVAEN